MSLLNFSWRVLAAVTVMVASPAVMGQVYHPFAEPLDVDPDWQFFAPVDIDSMTELSPRKRANEGWFATYDRTYIWVSRPNVEASSGHGDFGWGNRYDVGFMSERNSGWLFSFRNMGGPNVYDRIYQERINVDNPNDNQDPTQPLVPPQDLDDPQLLVRAYIIGDSLNVIGLTNFEINKTWRMRPYRYGGVLEPMIGFKYATLKDTALNQTYLRSQALISNPGTVAATTNVETLTSHETTIDNRMIGGQLGARYFTHVDRWTLSGEFRAFGAANFQDRSFAQRSFITEYSGVGAGSNTVTTDFVTGTQFIHDSNTEFAFGFEARAEAAYRITSYFNVRAGIDVLNFAKGIWRGANPGFGDVNVHDQDVQMAGFSFGLDINR